MGFHGSFGTKTFTDRNLYLYRDSFVLLSQRKINPLYNGPCMRVVRDSDNAEIDLYFNGNDLDTNTLNQWKSTTVGIKTWYDQSGRGNNATQTTFANMPKVVISGLLINLNYNSNQEIKTSINFLNSQSQFLNLPSGILNQWTEFSLFISLVNNTLLLSNQGLFGPTNTNSVGLEIVQTLVINRPLLFRINGTIRNDNSGSEYQAADNVSPVAPPNTNYNHQLATFIADKNQVSTYKNLKKNLLTNSSGISALNFNGIYSIGRYNATGNCYLGRIQEFILYNKNVGNRVKLIQDDIIKYYGLKNTKWL